MINVRISQSYSRGTLIVYFKFEGIEILNEMGIQYDDVTELTEVVFTIFQDFFGVRFAEEVDINVNHERWCKGTER